MEVKIQKITYTEIIENGKRKQEKGAGYIIGHDIRNGMYLVIKGQRTFEVPYDKGEII